jgi:hypothetical protein
MNLAFYTYFYGSNNNDSFTIPEPSSLKYNCYYITNNITIFERLKGTKWIPIFDNKPTTDDLIESCMAGKYIKTCPHLDPELNKYDYLCYLDNKYKVVSDEFIENYIIKCFIENDYALILKKHTAKFDSVWKEYDESMKQQRYRIKSNSYIDYINQQLKQGLSESTTNHCQCGFLIRNMKHKNINELNQTWYTHIQKCGIQDQISFFFVRQLFEKYIYSITETAFIPAKI